MIRLGAIASVLCLAGLELSAPVAAAQDSVQVEAFVLAAYNGDEAKVPKQIAAYADDLAETFGYSGFEVLGSDTRQLAKLSRDWLIPSKEFYLKIIDDSDSDWTRIYTELYRGQQLLVGVDAQLVKGKPLFIRGPQWGHRQIIIVVVAR